MFYDKEIKIIKSAVGFVDDDGIYHDGNEQEIKTISADIQPYSKEQAYKDYGFNQKVSYRIFCDSVDEIQIGVALEFYNNTYKVIKIIEWDDYMEVMVKTYE